MFDLIKAVRFAWVWAPTLVLVLGLGAMVPACGDDDDSTDGDTDGDTDGGTDGDTAGDTDGEDGDDDDTGGTEGSDGDFVSKAITVAAGGTVAIKTEAIVQIPAGALAADTTVTIREIASTGLPEAEKLGSPVFEFGPDGTTFSTPATITLELKKAVPTGKTAFVAFLKDGAWNTLADSAVSQDTVFATTTHFTPFAVYFADAAVSGGENCQAFTACGGDLVGGWNYAGSQNIGCVGKGSGACEAATATGTIISGLGDVTFSGDLKFAISRALTKSETINYPKSCAAGADAGKDCPALFPTELFPATVSENAGVCEVRADNAQINESYSGTYKLSGGQLEVTYPIGAGAFASRTFEYCVQGDKLTIKETGERFTQIVTATKKP